MTAAAVPLSSRRVSAGIDGEGRTARPSAWWGAEDWLADVEAALTDQLLREHHVSRDAVLAVAEAHAAHADFRTGRNCRPTNARLVQVQHYSLSVVQRARRVLKALQLVREEVPGRSYMTRAERLAAWRRGSAHRKIAATFALCSTRSRRAPKMTTDQLARGTHVQGADLQSVDGDTPPGALKVSTSRKLVSGPLRRQTENEERRSAPRAPTKASQGPRGVDPGTRRLAEGVRAPLGWLSGVSWRRLAPTLSRFARAGWTPRDVELAVRDALAARGWRVPRPLQHPAAYLATLLREQDPADRPSVIEDAYAAAMAAAAREKRAAERRWHEALRTSCAHGVPAGDVPHPLSGALACRECR